MIRERWTPSPLIAGSAAVHLAAVASIFMQPHWWPAVLVMLIANHALLTAAGLWPRSDWLGPNWTRLPAAAAARGCIALTLDDGPEPRVTPQVLDMLDDYQAKVRQRHLLTMRELPKNIWVEIARRVDRHPAGSNDMSGL